MKLNELLEMIRNDAQQISGEENPEVVFASTINANENIGGEYDGVFQLEDGRVVVDIKHEEIMEVEFFGDDFEWGR